MVFEDILSLCFFDKSLQDIIVQRIVFPAPPSSYDRSLSNLTYISNIPCLFFKKDSDKYMIYFHGNCTDLGRSHEFLKELSQTLDSNVIGVEYPKYGIYLSKISSIEDQVKKDAIKIYKSIIKAGVDTKNITIMGRSIGTGPAVYLASKTKGIPLVLISPFRNVLSLVENTPLNSLCNMLFTEIFDNERVKYIRSPILYIHGILDIIVPCDHSKELNKISKKGYLHLVNKGHNDLDYEIDIMIPLLRFQKKHKSSN